MTDLETLVRVNYGTEDIPPDCREAVLAYLNDFQRSESRKFNFIKGLTKVGHTLFKQEHQLFSLSALAALMDLHEEGIALMEAELKAIRFVEGEELSHAEFGRRKYISSSYVHLKGHLANILTEMDRFNLYPTEDSWRKGMEKAYDLAYSAGKKTFRTEVPFSLDQLNLAGKAAYRLYEETGDFDFAEKSYRAMTGRCLVTRQDGERRTSPSNLNALQRKAFVAQSVFRDIRKNREVPLEQLLLWGGRAYHSTHDRLVEGELSPVETANYHFDLAMIASTVMRVSPNFRLPQRAECHYQDVLNYIRKNDLATQLPHLVRSAQTNLQYILGDLYETE